MSGRTARFCAHAGCSAIVRGARYCDAHAAEHAAEQARREQERDRRRMSSRQRGYTTRWSKYSRWYLAQPGHQFCALHLDDGCAVVAQCVDHIVPHKGGSDPLFWAPSNHQPACIHCNSVKGARTMRGEYTYGCADSRSDSRG